MKTRYFLDTEFIEDGRTIELISIGVVCEDGREFYCESSTVDLTRANDWVTANVVPHLWHRQPLYSKTKRLANIWARDGGIGGLVDPRRIGGMLRRFVAAGEGTPEFWAYYADYDWVLVCQLFGRMLDLPEEWPKYCLDLKQEIYRLGLGREDLPEAPADEHHALADARWNRDVFDVIAEAAGWERPVTP